MQTLDHWREWKEKCALSLCGDDARRLLPGFAHARYAHYVQAYARTTNVDSPSALIPSAGESWHRFETHFRLHDRPGGKAYKDWLFARMSHRGYSPQASIEAGASLLLRDVVREHLRHEYSSRWMVSSSAGPGGAAPDVHSPSLEELLPGTADTAQEVQDRDLDELARAGARAAFAQLEFRERIAVFVHEIGLSLAHPLAARAAGCGRSVLNTAFHNALMAIASCVREHFPREGTVVQASLACRAYEQVRDSVLAWGRSEKRCAQLCRWAEAQPGFLAGGVPDPPAATRVGAADGSGFVSPAGEAPPGVPTTVKR